MIRVAGDSQEVVQQPLAYFVMQSDPELTDEAARFGIISNPLINRDHAQIAFASADLIPGYPDAQCFDRVEVFLAFQRCSFFRRSIEVLVDVFAELERLEGIRNKCRRIILTIRDWLLPTCEFCQVVFQRFISHDAAGNRQTVPSSILLQATRFKSHAAVLDFHDVVQRFGAVDDIHRSADKLNVIVALVIVAGHGNRMLSDGVVTFAVQRVLDLVDALAFQNAFNRRGQGRILIVRIVLAFLILSGNDNGLRFDCQLAGFILHRVVIQHPRAGRGDCITISYDFLSLYTADLQIQQLADSLIGISVLQSGNRSRQFGIRFAVGLGLVIRLDRQYCRCNFQCSPYIIDFIVLQYFLAARDNLFIANILINIGHRLTAGRPQLNVIGRLLGYTTDLHLQLIADCSLGIIVHQTADCCRELRIRITVILRRILRGYREQRLFNRQLAFYVGNRVVTLFRLAGRRDCIGTHILARFTADGVIYRVSVERAGNFRVKGSIGCSVGLRLVVCSHGNRRLVDRQRSGNHLDRELIRYIVTVLVGHLCGTRNSHRILARVCASRSRTQTAHGISMSVHLEGVRHYTVDRLLSAVVSIGIAAARDRDFILRITVLDIQIAKFGTDFIIVRIGAIAQRIAEGILRAANQRLATSHGIGRAFTFDEAITTHGHIIVGQRAAVIFLFIRTGSQDDRPLANRQRAGFVDHVVVALYCFSSGRDCVTANIRAILAAEAVR